MNKISEAGTAYENIGTIPFNRNELKSALNNFIKAKEIFESNKQYKNLAYILKAGWCILKMGLGLGMFNNKLDFTNVKPEDPTDPLYNTTDYNKTGFESSAGLMFGYKNLSIGASVPQMLAYGMKFLGQYNLIGMYKIKAGEKIALLPSVMFRTFPGFIPQEDFNLMGLYDNKYWLQAGYRTNKSMLFSAGLNLGMFKLGYCYEAVGGEVTHFAPNSHEIILGIEFGNKEKIVVDPNAGKINVMAKMTDNKTKQPVQGTVTFKQNSIPKYNYTGDTKGQCNFYADPGVYQVNVKAKGYVPINETVDLSTIPKGQPFNYSLSPIKLEKRLEFSMGAINFETNSDKLLPESFNILDAMAELLKENPNMVVEVCGHTDNTGTPDFNMDLSQKRSNSVINYVIAKGVDPKQIIPKGYGETRPIASNAMEDGRRQNRRVVFTILSMDADKDPVKVKTFDPERITPAAKTEGEAIEYIVESGDVLGTIALKFKVKVEDIKQWNNLTSDRINIGQKLIIYPPNKKC